MLDEIRHTAQRRLREIEPLIEEAERLRDVLRALERQPRQTAETRHAHASRPATPVASDARRGPRQRAAKGSNKRTIIELVAERPGITPAEIAASTSMKRTVVASTVSRLKRHGELCDHERGGLRVPDEQPRQASTEPHPVASLARRRAA